MTLDPKNWTDFRRAAHAMLDASIDALEQAKDGRVWTPVPEELKSDIHAPLPLKGNSEDDIQTDLRALFPYNVGNTHPRFFGWVHGAGSPSGLLSEMAASAMNINAGGRNHIAPVIEKQVIRWASEMVGLPPDTSGIITSGTSMATVVTLKVARDKYIPEASQKGVPQGRMVGYTSVQTHSCVRRGFDLLGLGRDALRIVPCDGDFQIDLDALKNAIAEDRAAGFIPFIIIGTAGDVNTGAIDDLEALADMAKDEDLWFHVDGAFGATANIGKHAKARLTGLSRADSVAFDFHKWMQVNYEAGCALIRDPLVHRTAFSSRPDYLRSTERGLAGGDYWAVDHGPELSRNFRALKVWAHIKHHGINALAAVVDRNIEQAQYLERLVKASPKLEMLAPVPLNICCFRYKFTPVSNDHLNSELIIKLQQSGIAVTSSTRINGDFAIRVNITNHRTRNSDLDLLVETIETIGDALKQHP